VSDFYLDPVGSYETGLGNIRTQDVTSANWATEVFYRPAGCTYFKRQLQTAPGPTTTSLGNTEQFLFDPFGNLNGGAVMFKAAGSDTMSPGAIRWFFASAGADGMKMDTAGQSGYSAQLSTDPIGEIVLQEDAGQHDGISHYPVLTRFPIYSMSLGAWRFKTSDSATSVAYYNGINLADTGSNVNLPLASTPELRFYTERGSIVSGVVLNGASIAVAKKVAQPTFNFNGKQAICLPSQNAGKPSSNPGGSSPRSSGGGGFTSGGGEVKRQSPVMPLPIVATPPSNENVGSGSQEAQVTLTAPENAVMGDAVILKLVDASSQPVQGFQVLVHAPGGSTLKPGFTNADGQTSFQPPTVGHYTYSVVGRILVNKPTTDVTLEQKRPVLAASAGTIPVAGAGAATAPNNPWPWIAILLALILLLIIAWRYLSRKKEAPN
jgi:hypothetical protein